MEIEVHKDEKIAKLIFTIMGLLIVVLLIEVIYLNISYQKRIGENLTKSMVTPTEYYLSDVIPSITVSPSPTMIPSQFPTTQFPTIPQQAEKQKNLIKEYFIAFGTGTGQNTDWTDVQGLQAVINFDNYSDIKEVFFESSVTVPTGNEWVSVRLYNKTDQHPVWNSEVFMKDSSTPYLASSPVSYDRGSKTYQVQMKTQLGYPANLTQSRLHITLK